MLGCFIFKAQIQRNLWILVDSYTKEFVDFGGVLQKVNENKGLNYPYKCDD